MITKEELQQLLMSTETFRVERTVSTNNMDKFCEAICAFSNDIPDSRQNGYLILGANDDGSLSGLKVDKARPENFPTVNDYRNPIISEAMKVMGYVNKFNRGIDRVQRMLLDNGSPQAQFDVNKLTVFEVVVNECKAANSETTEQVTIPVTVPVTVPLTMPVEELLGVFQGEMSRTELMNILNLKNKAHFKTEYIRKALELGVIEMTQPDSPNSPTQKYRLTEKGKLLVK